MRSSLNATLLLAGLFSLAAACGDDSGTTGTSSGTGGSGGSGSGGSPSTTTGSQSGPTTTTGTQSGPTTTTGTQSGPTTSSGTGGDPTGTGGDPTGTGGDPSGTGGDPSGTGGDPTGTGGDPTGTGGDPTGTGGFGQTASSSVASTGVASTSVASTGVASTATTSTGGQQCTAITLDDLQFAYSADPQAPPLYVSEVSPELDTAATDLVGLFLFDETAGVFDLAAEGDFNECNRCLLGNVDQDPNTGDPAKIFYQESGTFTLSAVGNAALSGNATFSLANVTLIEVTVDDQGVSTPVPNGECLFLAAASFNDPVPATWTCDETFYEDFAGCDCECGAYDPDCDDDEQTIFGCTAGQTCEPPTGTCEGGGGQTFTLDSGTVNASIPDNSGTGVCVPMQFPTDGVIATIDSVTVSLNHTWAGDVTLELRSPDPANFFAELVSTAGGGNANANFASTSPIIFTESAVRPAETIGQGLTTDQVICAQDGVCSFIPQESFTLFLAGAPADGTWNLCGFDSASFDTGNIVRVQATGTLE